MIAISAHPLPAGEPTDEQRQVLSRSRFRARWMSAYALLPALLIVASAAAPLGHFYALWIIAGLLFLFALPVLGVAGTSALLRARRWKAPLARSAARWWAAPWLVLGLGIALSTSPWPRQLGWALARPGLARLAAEAKDAPASQVDFGFRWAGAWPLDEIRRYAEGELRLSVLGTDSPAGHRGLFYAGAGAPLDGNRPRGSWSPDRFIELGDGWHAWYRSEPR